MATTERDGGRAHLDQSLGITEHMLGDGFLWHGEIRKRYGRKIRLRVKHKLTQQPTGLPTFKSMRLTKMAQSSISGAEDCLVLLNRYILGLDYLRYNLTGNRNPTAKAVMRPGSRNDP